MDGLWRRAFETNIVPSGGLNAAPPPPVMSLGQRQAWESQMIPLAGASIARFKPIIVPGASPGDPIEAQFDIYAVEPLGNWVAASPTASLWAVTLVASMAASVSATSAAVGPNLADASAVRRNSAIRPTDVFANGGIVLTGGIHNSQSQVMGGAANQLVSTGASPAGSPAWYEAMLPIPATAREALLVHAVMPEGMEATDVAAVNLLYALQGRSV